jgi:hypothetical protein
LKSIPKLVSFLAAHKAHLALKLLALLDMSGQAPDH